MLAHIPFILSQIYWHAPALWPIAALATAALLGAVLLLYPGQLNGVSWPWRGILPALRLLAVLAVVVSVLKPVAMRPATAEERGVVVVLVDRSRSMAVVDNARTHAQLVALADAMGKLKPAVRSDAATTLAAELERLRTFAADVRGAQEDLDYARVSGRDIQVRQSRLQEVASRYAASASALADKAAALPHSEALTRELSELAHPPQITSGEGWRLKVAQQINKAVNAVADYRDRVDDQLYQSDQEVRSACDEISRLSRFSLVEQALLRPGGIVASARREAAVSGFGFAEDVASLELIRGDDVVTALNATPDGDKSDITAAITRAVSGRPVLAVVLFSDGRQVGGDATVVSGLTTSGVPIFTVNAAASDPPRDLSFDYVKAPPSIFAGQPITVKVKLRHDFFENQTVELHCKIGNEKEQVSKIVLRAKQDAITSFTARLSKPNAQHVERVRVWFPKVPGEASGENNQAERWVKVVPERIKVLMIAGSPTWDFQYVRTALAAQPEMQVKDIVLDPVNPRIWIPPKEILSQDVIILFDVPVAAFDEKHWEAVQRMAQVTGGSVILVAGDSHLPGEYVKFASTASLLPFQTTFKPAWSTWPGPAPAFHFVPAPDSEGLDFLKLPSETPPKPPSETPPQPGGDAKASTSGDTAPRPPAESDTADADPNPRRWEQLPGCLRFLQLPEIRNKQLKQQAQVLLVEEESRLPVLTEMRLGAGRAFFLGFNETWRWRFKVGGRDQDHFWRQLIQHASEDPYFAHDGPLALDVDSVSALPNDRIHVRARITEEMREADMAQTLQVLAGSKRISEIPLTPSGPAGGGRFVASLALPAGEYEIRWSVAGEGRTAHSVTIPLHIGGTSEKELADLSGDQEMLRKLAEASGGEFLTLEQIGRLPQRLAAAGDARSRLAEMPLWDSPWLFALVVGCLGAEWALRKRVGLA